MLTIDTSQLSCILIPQGSATGFWCSDQGQWSFFLEQTARVIIEDQRTVTTRITLPQFGWMEILKRFSCWLNITQWTRYTRKKNLYNMYVQHVCILKPTDKISGTFLVIIIKHRVRNITRAKYYLHCLPFGMYHHGTNSIFSSTYFNYIFHSGYIIIKQS